MISKILSGEKSVTTPVLCHDMTPVSDHFMATAACMIRIIKVFVSKIHSMQADFREIAVLHHASGGLTQQHYYG